MSLTPNGGVRTGVEEGQQPADSLRMQLHVGVDENNPAAPAFREAAAYRVALAAIVGIMNHCYRSVDASGLDVRTVLISV
jgi:hypothetical protein